MCGHAVVATDDHIIRVYDVSDGYVLASHKGHEDTINAIIHIPEVFSISFSFSLILSFSFLVSFFIV